MPCRCVLLAYMGLSIWDGAPRTIQYEIDDWRNDSWGLHNIERRTIRCETAIAGNGSRMNKCVYESFHHYLLRSASGSIRDLYIQPTHSGYSIDDKNRIASGGECKCTWDAPRQMPDDGACSQTAAQRLNRPERVGTNRIAGAVVVEYRSEEAYGTFRRISLAPEYGCEVMEQVDRTKGTLGIPGSQWRYRVTSYKPGEPSRSVFEVPPGYRVESAK